MKLFKDIYKFLLGEQLATNKNGVPKYLNNNSSRPGSIANAVKKRNPVSFFYNGPRGKVQPGKRVKAELVALGLSKKGKMVVRAWVDQPSRTKTGFEKTNWRTFMVSRMNQVEIFDEETFDQKREGYKEGDDKSMSVTYVKSDWSSTPEPQREPEVEPTQQREPEVDPQEPTQQREPEVDPQEPTQQREPEVEPTVDDLPQPEPNNTPSIEPPIVDDNDEDDNDEDQEDNNYDNLNESINRIKELLYYSK